MKGSDETAAEKAYQRAVGILARRDHSCGELLAKLTVKGVPAAVAEAVVRRLREQGYLDDSKFATRWVEAALRTGRGYGPRLLHELQRKGISREEAQQAVAAATAENPAGQVLAAIIARRFASFQPESATLKERRRVYSCLQRCGFSLAAITEYFRDYNTGVT